MLHILNHFLGVINFVYAIYADVYLVDLPKPNHRESFGGLWKYLTFINLWVQLIFFGICLLNDAFGSVESVQSKASRLQKIRDFMFVTIAFPIGVFVGVMFWSLYHIDRNLIWPEKFDTYYGPWLNHAMHTLCLPLIMLELVKTFHHFPSRKVGSATTTIFCSIYCAWLLFIKYFSGHWVYPFFKLLSPVGRAAFIVACCALGGSFYFLGEFLTSKIWPGKMRSDAVQGDVTQPSAEDASSIASRVIGRSRISAGKKVQKVQ